MSAKIITNHVPRNMVYGWDLSEKERKEFDYLSNDEIQDHNFFRYKDNVYDVSEFMWTNDIPEFKGWDGYSSDSFFSGILIKLCDNAPYYDSDKIIVGWYLS